jgi:hypothetical protein
MENKNTIQYRINELGTQANKAKGLGELTRINHELENLREQQSENEMLGIYESGCSPEYVRRNRVRW